MKFTLELQKIMADNNYLIAIRDNFEHLLIRSVLNVADRRINAEDINKSVKNRVFSIVVECVQNICKTTTNRKKDSILLLNKVGEDFQVIAGSKIKKEKKDRIAILLDELSNAPREQIRELWKAAIMDPDEFDLAKRENLALIGVHLKSKGEVVYFFEEAGDGMFYFMVKIKISNS